jgi:hypothetical protein
MYHKYVERNDGHANHRQPIFLAVLYHLRNSVLEESHRRNQTTTGEDQTPQNWAYSFSEGLAHGTAKSYDHIPSTSEVH